MTDNFSSSDDDLYDNFEKYKQKCKTKCDVSLLSMRRELSNEFIPSVNRFSEPHSDDEEPKIRKTAKEKRRDTSIDFDAEFAELPTLVVPARSSRTANDEKLKKILRETQLTLDSLQHVPEIASGSEKTDKNTPVEFKKRCTLNLKNSSTGQSFIVRCNMDDPFKDLITDNAERLQMDAAKIVFMGRDCRFYPGDTPLSVGLNEHSVNEVDVYEEFESCKISLKWLLKGRKPIVMVVLATKTFENLKQEFCAEQDLDVAKTRLVFDSEKLDGDETPQSLDIEDGDCIDVYVDS